MLGFLNDIFKKLQQFVIFRQSDFLFSIQLSACFRNIFDWNLHLTDA